mgnify:CR=1 FL=1
MSQLFDTPPPRASVKMETSWAQALEAEFSKPYFLALVDFLKTEKQSGHVIYPPGSQIFNAFDLTPIDNVRVVILGQDPYHGPGQAHGLCFSVQRGVPPPPSLVNIFQELYNDLNVPSPRHGNLEHWARQGVLLLNATLTVRAGQAGSHQGKGWETFTDAVMECLNARHAGLVFLLWGKFAQAKARCIDPQRHHMLQAAHPSPLAARNGFFGCRHFSKTNALLEAQGKAPIEWQIPD